MKEPSKLQPDIDRLIDGELSQAEVTAVLERCEGDPHAWRSLALGLLEAREIKLALQELLASPPVVQRQPRRDMKSHVLTWVLSAACLVCAGFLTGWFLPKPTPLEIGATSPLAGEKAMPEQDAIRPDGQFVGFARIHGMTGQPQLPVIAGRNVDFEAILREPIKVPSEVLRQYRNRGLAIQATRRVVAFEFDGQRFAIPLDQFGVRYVGNDIL